MTLDVTVLTLFPEMFPGPLGHSILGTAFQKNLWTLKAMDIRDFADDKHKTVDDICFGGGPGMVFRPDVVDRALASAMKPGQARLLNLTPRGRPFTQALAVELATSPLPLVFLCGRYEGIDQRVLEVWEAEDVSLGDFVLAGGEVAAMTMIEAIVRLIPGVVGDQVSLEEESFSQGLLEYPHYTRPRTWQGHDVPEVLISGHHKNIARWRQQAAEAITRERRPDLWEMYRQNRNFQANNNLTS